MPRQSGFTLLEVLFTMALLATVVSIALPAFSDAVDAYRTASAARYVAGRVNLARMDAVKRNTNVGLKFDEAGSDYTFAEYVDGNANGIRNLDIRTGLDRLLAEKVRLANSFSGVQFGLMPGVPDADGAADRDGGDGVRIGSARILTLGANGTATSGTLYVRGRRRQFAVRVLGVTGRARVMRYDAKSRKWLNY